MYSHNKAVKPECISMVTQTDLMEKLGIPQLNIHFSFWWGMQYASLIIIECSKIGQDMIMSWLMNHIGLISGDYSFITTIFTEWVPMQTSPHILQQFYGALIPRVLMDELSLAIWHQNKIYVIEEALQCWKTEYFSLHGLWKGCLNWFKQPTSMNWD